MRLVWVFLERFFKVLHRSIEIRLGVHPPTYFGNVS